MNENVATISLELGGVIDTAPMIRYFQKCIFNRKFNATDSEYQAFLARREDSCMANHK